MIASHRVSSPRIAPTACIDPGADVRREVSVDAGAAVPAGTVLTAGGGA